MRPNIIFCVDMNLQSLFEIIWAYKKIKEFHIISMKDTFGSQSKIKSLEFPEQLDVSYYGVSNGWLPKLSHTSFNRAFELAFLTQVQPFINLFWSSLFNLKIYNQILWMFVEAPWPRQLNFNFRNHVETSIQFEFFEADSFTFR